MDRREKVPKSLSFNWGFNEILPQIVAPLFVFSIGIFFGSLFLKALQTGRAPVTAPWYRDKNPGLYWFCQSIAGIMSAACILLGAFGLIVIVFGLCGHTVECQFNGVEHRSGG